MSFRPRWYGADVLGNGAGRKWPELQDRGVVQVPRGFAQHYGKDPNKFFTLPMELLRIAGDEYEAQGFSQTFERLQERGGFGLLELVMLLADAVERRDALFAAASPSKGDAPG